MALEAAEALTVSGAARMLTEQRQTFAQADNPAPVVEAPVVAAEPLDEQTTQDQAPSVADTIDAAETPGDDGAVIEPAKPAVEPPHYWSAEEKAEFAELSPKLQAKYAEQWKGGERRINMALEEAATARKAAEQATKAAETKAAETAQVFERINAVADKAAEIFKGRWEGITPQDWSALAQQNPDQFVQLKAQYDAEQAELQRIQSARQEADQLASAEAQKAELAKTQERAASEAAKVRAAIPDFGDPQKAKPLWDRIVSFAKARGATDAEIANASAMDVIFAHEAMLAAEARAALVAPKPQPTKQAPAAKPPVRPGSASAEPRQTPPAKAMDRLKETGSINDAVAALRAKRQLRQ